MKPFFSLKDHHVHFFTSCQPKKVQKYDFILFDSDGEVIRFIQIPVLAQAW